MHSITIVTIHFQIALSKSGHSLAMCAQLKTMTNKKNLVFSNMWYNVLLMINSKYSFNFPIVSLFEGSLFYNKSYHKCWKEAI